MQSYGNPVCATTNNAAALFCSAEGCNLPAFGCSALCFNNHIHGEMGFDIKLVSWKTLELPLRQIVDRSPLPADIETLERQEKQLVVLIDSLR